MKQESKIQQEIFKDFHNRHPTFIIHSVPNGGTRNKLEAIELKRTGLVSGIADLIIHLPDGLCVMVEVKNESGKQSKEQIKIQNKMIAMNSNYILVRSLKDFNNQIQKYL
jgi:hypothetical protein